MKGHYPCPSVQKAHDRRLIGLEHSRWVEAMAFLINALCDTHFRWFDVGDVQSKKHFMDIIEVCNQTPEVRHWLPTQERKIVKDCQMFIPDNLCVRVSSIFIDLPHTLLGFPISFTTIKLDNYPDDIQCQAYDGKCGRCRKCWDKTEPLIGYKLR